MRKIYKRIVCFVLSFLMLLSCGDFGIFKESKVWAQGNSLKVKVRIEANDHTIVSEKEMEICEFDLKEYGIKESSGKITPIHAIIKALESENINCKDNTKFNSNDGTYLDNIGGVKQGSVGSKDGWMYYINNKYVPEYLNKIQLQSGDSLVVFFQEDYEKNTYSYFNKNLIKAKTGEDINLKLLGLKFDVYTNELRDVSVKNAKILVNNKDYVVNGKYINTDKEGNATLKFDKEGTYEISAVRFDKESSNRDISRPYCKVVVEKGEVIVDKTSLKDSIKKGEKLLNTAIIGTEAGQYSKESIDLFKISIDEAKVILNKEEVTVDEIKKAILKLENSIFKFKNSVNKDEGLLSVIADVLSYYSTWKDNPYKQLDFITAMALRRAGVDTDKLASKINIYGMEGVHNNARNVMSIIGIGKNPKNYKDKDYTQFLVGYDYNKENSSENIAKAIIAMDMANVKYDKEKVVEALLSKAQKEKDGKISFGKISESYWDDFFEEEVEGEYTSSIDCIAWSLIALANHKDLNNSKEVIDGCIKFLKSKQGENGLIQNSADTALVIQALILLGENPKDDYWCILDGDKKISMLEGILKCKTKNEFMLTEAANITSDLATSHVLASLVDLNTMCSMYKSLKYEEESVPVKVEILGENQVYSGEILNLEAKAYDFNNVVIKNAAISWNSSDKNIANVENGKVKALKEGEVEITAYISGTDKIKASKKVKVVTPPEVDYSDRLKEEIEFLKDHYVTYGSYEFLASPAATLSGVDKSIVKDKIYKYSKNSTGLLNAKMIIAYAGAGLNLKCANMKDTEVNYVEILEKSQIVDGENKGKFIINKSTDETSIETQAYSIIALDLVEGKYNKELAVKALLDMLNDSNYKEDISYKNIKTEAVAACALANHKDILGTENKINELIKFFKENQNEDGAFNMVAGSTFVNSPVATGAVVQALVANDINPLSWQWVNNGKTILDGMLKSKFQGRDASTSGYSQGEGLDFENSEATYYAYSALVQMLSKKSIYDMTKEFIKEIPEESKPKEYELLVNNTINNIINKNILLGNDWYTIELKKSGREVPKDYLKEVTKVVVDAKGKLSSSTEYAKKTLSILAAGGDPTNVGGYNLVEKIYNGNLDQGLNAYVFSLIALESGNFNISSESKWDKEKLIDIILQSKTKENGWTFFGSAADVDATAMTIASLAPYYNSKIEVKEAIDKSLNLLSNLQTSKGGFKSLGSENSNSISMVIIALSTLNIDIAKDSRFIKNNNTIIDALMEYKTKDDTFGFSNNKYNELSTEQALRALVAYKNFKEKKGSIYKFDFTPPVEDKKDIEIKNISKSKEIKLGQEAKIIVQAINLSKETKSAMLIVGLFDKEDKLINYVGVNQNIEGEKKVELIGRIKVPKEGEFEIKAFVWDSLDNMKPLSNVIEIPVK
ncbi:DUF4430 domain-containing protein [Clostridium rectalis]|uniref:DUF4430 domain-containing protein n=1 Tax=Clostridium rectalis TaxID=2040295 RepID=UPI0013DE2331|nr:DUF4430 domain-containing protein [Clostridium rectalis]